MPVRRTAETLPERVAFIEEELRRRAADTATRPVVTDYAALTGAPTDLVTVADLNDTLAPIAAGLEDLELLEWLGGPT